MFILSTNEKFYTKLLLDFVVSPSQSDIFWTISEAMHETRVFPFSPHCGQRWHPAAKMSQKCNYTQIRLARSGCAEMIESRCCSEVAEGPRPEMKPIAGTQRNSRRDGGE